jgi:hypothetical protein
MEEASPPVSILLTPLSQFAERSDTDTTVTFERATSFHTSQTLLRVFLVSHRIRCCMKDLVLLCDVEHFRPPMTSRGDVMRTGSCDLCTILQNHYLEVGIIRRVVTTLVQLL